MKFKILLFTLGTLFTFFVALAQNTLAKVELEAENVSSVRLDGLFCNVVITPGTTTYFKGIIEGSGNPDDYEIFTKIDGDELVIEVDKRGSSWNRITRSLLELTLKPGVSVYVDNTSGDIIAEGIEADEFSFEATSGDIELENIMGNLRINTTSGDVEIDGAKGRIEIESTSGDQELRSTAGDVEFKSTSGEISIRGFDGEIIGQATSGDISLSDGTGMLRLRTTSGEIEGNAITLTGDCEFNSNSGDVEMDFTNSIEELSFDLEASSGDLRVGNRSGEDELYIKRGGYLIRGVTTSGSQRYSGR